MMKSIRATNTIKKNPHRNRKQKEECEKEQKKSTHEILEDNNIQKVEYYHTIEDKNKNKKKGKCH
jgi:hypothetical protein